MDDSTLREFRQSLANWKDNDAFAAGYDMVSKKRMTLKLDATLKGQTTIGGKKIRFIDPDILAEAKKILNKESPDNKEFSDASKKRFSTNLYSLITNEIEKGKVIFETKRDKGKYMATTTEENSRYIPVKKDKDGHIIKKPYEEVKVVDKKEFSDIAKAVRTTLGITTSLESSAQKQKAPQEIQEESLPEHTESKNIEAHVAEGNAQLGESIETEALTKRGEQIVSTAKSKHAEARREALKTQEKGYEKERKEKEAEKNKDAEADQIKQGAITSDTKKHDIKLDEQKAEELKRETTKVEEKEQVKRIAPQVNEAEGKSDTQTTTSA
jgi:hypothetical protein